MTYVHSEQVCLLPGCSRRRFSRIVRVVCAHSFEQRNCKKSWLDVSVRGLASSGAYFSQQSRRAEAAGRLPISTTPEIAVAAYITVLLLLCSRVIGQDSQRKFSARSRQQSLDSGGRSFLNNQALVVGWSCSFCC